MMTHVFVRDAPFQFERSLQVLLHVRRGEYFILALEKC